MEAEQKSIQTCMANNGESLQKNRFAIKHNMCYNLEILKIKTNEKTFYILVGVTLIGGISFAFSQGNF